jgi:hypothetical protein
MWKNMAEQVSDPKITTLDVNQCPLLGVKGHQRATIRSLLLTLIGSRAPERYSTNLIFDLSQRRLCDGVGTER